MVAVQDPHMLLECHPHNQQQSKAQSSRHKKRGLITTFGN